MFEFKDMKFQKGSVIPVLKGSQNPDFLKARYKATL